MQIKDDAFSTPAFSQLEYLKILEIPIEVLKPEIFNGLKKLRLLILRGLNLKSIHKDVLAPMLNLEVFFLSRCGPFKVLTDNFFGYTKMHHLYDIRIFDCVLKDTITENTFASIPSVSFLMLDSNSIDKIGPKSFDAVLKTLKNLQLPRNRLTTIPQDLFKSDREVLIDLTSNPLHCDCTQMENLRQFAQTTRIVNFFGFVCSTPEKYSGHDLMKSASFCDDTTNDFSTTTFDLKDESEDTIEEILFPSTELNFESTASTVAVDFSNTLSPSKIPFPEKIPKKKIYAACENSVSTQVKKLIEITKPSHKVDLIIRIEKEELHIDSALLSDDFKLIELNHIQSDESNEMVFNQEKACTAYFKCDKIKSMKFKRKLERNILYRFCWMQKESDTIFPLDCVTFHLGSNEEGALHLESDGNNLDAWVMKSDKPILITVWSLLAIFGPVFGILIAVVLAKLFPRMIRGPKPDLKRSVSQRRPNSRRNVVATPMGREAINRLMRYVFV